MDEKVIKFENNGQVYFRLAEKRIESEDYVGALSLLFKAKDLSRDIAILMSIADVYSQMELYELSNKYWFYYMVKAPKEKVGIAYEELAINFFYMGDYISSSYYFHKKLITTGYIEREYLDPEIIDFFSGEEEKQDAYYIAYPFDKADYSSVAKRAKRAIGIGDFNQAIKLYKSIPKECLDLDSASELSFCYLMTDRMFHAIDVAKDSLNLHGENVGAYCSLANAYYVQEEYEKSDYYYEMALGLEDQENSQYKLMPCAIERQDHKVVKTVASKILRDRPCDVTMQFFLGLAMLNTGEYAQAYDQLAKAYKLDPNNRIYKFYTEYAWRLLSQINYNEQYLPVKYVERLPEKLEQEYKRTISLLSKNAQKASSALRKEQTRQIIEWGLTLSTEPEVARHCVYILGRAFNPYAKSLLKSILIDSQVHSEVKQVTVYALIVKGVREKINVVDNNLLFTIKPRGLMCEDMPLGDIFVTAYALALSKIAFLGVENLDKLAKAIDCIYDEFEDEINKFEQEPEMIATTAVWLCKFERFTKDKDIIKLFGVQLESFDNFRQIFDGDELDD